MTIEPLNILLVNFCAPRHGTGTEIVLHRHLMLWKRRGGLCTVCTPSAGLSICHAESILDYLVIPIRKWWWPPFRENNRVLYKLRIIICALFIAYRLRRSRFDVVVSTCYSFYCDVALMVSYIRGCPFVLILHDQEELFKSGKSERAIALARAKRASARADLILPVTAELAAAYEIDKEKTKIMRPIPGSRKDIVIKECRQKLTTSFVFSGSYFDTYFSALVRIAMVAAEESGTLTIISDNSRLSEKFRAMGCKNVHVIKSFSTNDEAVQYVADSGATFVVIYPAQLKSHAWAATSFPSKFVDFVRAEVPILVIAPKETPIARWCLNNNWGSYIRPTLSMCEFRCSLRRLMTSESWDRGAKQSRLLSMGEFSQETIQKHFEDGILAVIR